MKSLPIKLIFLLYLFFSSSDLFCQSYFKKYKQLTKPERHWVIAHLFIAKKAFHITQQVETDIAEIKKSGVIGTDNNGGKLDAYKHSYWMASLALRINSKKALKLGYAHEEGNKIQWEKHQLEETILPDSVSSEMDKFNNMQGVIITKSNTLKDKQDLQKAIMEALIKGKLMIIKKDKQGNFLYCNNEIISLKDFYGKWNIPKCLINSNK